MALPTFLTPAVVRKGHVPFNLKLWPKATPCENMQILMDFQYGSENDCSTLAVIFTVYYAIRQPRHKHTIAYKKKISYD